MWWDGSFESGFSAWICHACLGMYLNENIGLVHIIRLFRLQRYCISIIGLATNLRFGSIFGNIKHQTSLEINHNDHSFLLPKHGFYNHCIKYYRAQLQNHIFHKSFITKNIILIFIYIYSTVKTNNIYCSAHMNQYTYIVVPFCLQCNIKTYFLYNKQKFQHFLFIVFIYPYISFYTLHHFRIAFTQVWKYILETCHNDNYWQWNIVGI